ncbi:MAG TPA: PQQ-binding-like beta-propeller repeat protein [Ktedonobacteraceae bacterium]|nr:PQQ-binding-like beta-propeller repeat protein [Ktedonobacteraceae bacterium]
MRQSEKRWGANRYWMTIAGMVVVLTIVYTVLVNVPIQHAYAVAGGAWPTYLGDNARNGYNANEKIINPNTAPNLKVHWTFHTGGSISTQPVEYNGQIYFGSWDGNEYATDLNGRKIWSTFISPPTPDCQGINRTFGVTSTATIDNIPINGKTTTVILVGSSDAHVYALNAATGAVIWKTLLTSVPHTFLWSNAAAYKGSIYMGISSVDDCPLVPGGLAQLNVITGAVQHIFYDVPNGCVGASIWASPAINAATGRVYVAVGNPGACNAAEPYGSAVLEFRATDLTLLDYWPVPAAQLGGDDDFGATPTLFTATLGGTVHEMIGVENKNGFFYALDQTSLHSGPVWEAKVGTGRLDIAAAAFDGKNLYVASLGTTINGKHCSGSLRAVNPATGAFIWQDCLGAPIHLGVSVVPGVVFAGIGAAFVAIASATGKALFGYKLSNDIYGTTSISQGVAYIGDASGNIYAFGL